MHVYIVQLAPFQNCEINRELLTRVVRSDIRHLFLHVQATLSSGVGILLICADSFST